MSNRVKQFAWMYGITALVFFLIDLVWIGVVAKDFYANTIGHLLRDSVNWPAALVFYILYIGGIVVFVLFPAIRDQTSIRHTAVMGGLLGLFAYGTFDLTALALLEGWTVGVTVVDMAWGTILTGGTASASLWVTRTFLTADTFSHREIRKECRHG